MKRRYRSSSDPQHSELTARLVAAFVTFGCLCFFGLFAAPEKQPTTKVRLAPAAPLEPPPARIDPTETYRAVPGNWADTDFKYHDYGPYKLFGGKKLPLTLKNGEYEYDFGGKGRGWFSLQAVYYFDVTGDRIPDAIVDLSHVECGYGSCDGGAHLIFIYSINTEGKIEELFQYESGSYAYGCGLKSITVESKQVSLEIFGRCPRPGKEYMGPGKDMVEDLTRLSFWFSDKGFIQTNMEFVYTGLTDVDNYRAEFRFKEDPANEIRP